MDDSRSSRSYRQQDLKDYPPLRWTHFSPRWVKDLFRRYEPTSHLDDSDSSESLDLVSIDTPTDYTTEMSKIEKGVTPVLMWGAAESVHEGQDNGTSMAMLVRLLRRIDTTLSEDRLYRENSRCSWKNLLIRYEGMRPLAGYMARKRVVGSEYRTVLSPSQATSTADWTEVLVQTVHLPEARKPSGASSHIPDSPSEHDSDSIDLMCRVDELMEDIYFLSRSILALFIPIENPSLGNLEWVISSYWGALDRISAVSYLTTTLLQETLLTIYLEPLVCS